MGQAVPLFSGDYDVTPRSRWGSGQLQILHDEPLPFTILAVIQEVEAQ
jgi:hypothetical protein